MKILLDTHVLIWIATNQHQHFSPQVLSIFEHYTQHEIYVSVASLWEIAIKSGLNKPNFNYSAEQMVVHLRRLGIHLLNIDVQHIFVLKNLPSIHRDPFDRLLIAQAQVEKLQFFTADQAILNYALPNLVNV